MCENSVTSWLTDSPALTCLPPLSLQSGQLCVHMAGTGRKGRNMTQAPEDFCFKGEKKKS
jgi:hypothetical protein